MTIDAKAYKLPQVYANELLSSSDLMALMRFDYENYTDLVSLLSDLPGASTPSYDVIIGGMYLQWTSGLSCTLNSGLAASYKGSYYNNDVWGFIAQAGYPFAVVCPGGISVSFAAGSSQNRIDLVEISPVVNNIKSEIRQFKDPVSLVISQNSVNVRTEIGINVKVVQGTPGANPVCPSADAGYIKIAEVSVLASAASINQSSIIDFNFSSLWTTNASSVLPSKSSQAIVSSSMMRDSNGRSQVLDPLSKYDIVNLETMLKSSASNWDSGTSYSQYALVNYQGIIYLGITNSNLNNNPSTDDGTNWAPYSSSLSTWNSQKSYSANMIVVYSGVLYISVTSSNKNNNPSSDDGTNWVPYNSSLTTWNTKKSYGLNDIANYSGVLYISLSNPNKNNNPGTDNGTNWEPYIYRSAVWSSQATYALNDITTLGGILYKSNANSNKNNNPSTDNGTNWIQLQTGGGSLGINYISNPDFETQPNVSSWNLYNDGVSATPVDGTGGVATITAARNNSSPLFGKYDMIVTKGASNVQGQGWSTDFAIDIGAQGQALTIKATYKVAGSYVDNDVGVYLYDITNAVFIPVSVQNLVGAGGSTVAFVATFIPSSSLSYRLIFHIQTTNALAWTFEQDNIQVGPQTVINQIPVSGPTTFTPTIAGFGSTSVTLAEWRRVADRMIVDLKFTAGTVAASEASITIPNGYTSSRPLRTCGYWERGNGTGTTVKGGTLREGETSTLITFSIEDYTTATSPLVATGLNGSGVCGNSEVVVCHFEIRIDQWSSSINLATDFTEYAFNTQGSVNTNDTTSFGYGSGGTPILANTATTYYDIQFLRPIQATDKISIEVMSVVDGSWIPAELAGIPSLFMSAINSGLWSYYSSSSGNLVAFKGFWFAKIAANKIRVYTSTYLQGSSTYTDGGSSATRSWANVIAAADGFTRWRVRKTSGGNSAEQVPFVGASYYSASFTFTTANVTPLLPTTRDFDTNNSFNMANAGAYTAPFTGFVRVSLTGVTPATNVTLVIYKNGSSYRPLVSQPTSNAGTISGSLLIPVNTGDYIDVRCNVNSITMTQITLQFEMKK